MIDGKGILEMFNEQPTGVIEGYKTLDQHIDEALNEAKKQQRHACSEAVSSCDQDAIGECIWLNDARAACMNAYT